MANRRFRSKPRKVSGFIEASLHPNAVRRIRVSEIRLRWDEVVGGTLAGKSSVSGIDGERLLVVAYSSSAAQQIKMRAGTICRRIKYTWNMDFSGISVFVGKERPRADGKLHVSEGPGRVIIPSKQEVRRELDIILDKLDDNELARSIAGLRAIYKKRFSGKKELKS